MRPFKADVPILSDNTFLPRNFYNGYPDIDFNTRDTHKFGYILNYQFNENWQIRNNLSVVLNSTQEAFSIFSNLVDDCILQGSTVSQREYDINNYFGQIDLLGKFKTGTITHQLLIGFDANQNVENFESRSGAGLGDLDILNPNYNTSVVSGGSYQITEESIEDADSDVIFVLGGDKKAIEALQKKPLWKKIKAVQQGHVYFVDDWTWTASNLIAADAVIDDLYKYLVKTH